MSTLDRELRRTLEKTIRKAREEAEQAAADAIARLGVTDAAAPAYLSEAEKTLRVRLRAHARTLGDGWDALQRRLLGTARLCEAVAYEAWHRMLFGRFLVERGLLIHPDLGVAIGRDELKELAAEDGLSDEWALVERLAAPALPAVFRPDDPVLAVTLAGDSTKRLRDLVVALPETVFAAEDSLGWTYQFWRASEKDAVNKKGEKIGAADLPAVTQLFTEPYMVKFLLHNTLGAWWAGKVLATTSDLARDALDEAALRAACALPGVPWEFLRFVREGEDGTGLWRPAAGVFPGWPQRAAEITFLDPCAGSGHFLVEAFDLLAALRQAEENLSGEEAARAVLRDNLHGLEIDGRCVQIAAFNVALAAWAIAGGPVELPQPHIAWVGAQPPARADVTALSGGDPVLLRTLEAIHDQFSHAPLVGSMLEIGARDLLDVDLRKRGEAALARLRTLNPEQREGVVAARGLLDAASLLGRRYVLQATNVPFLGRSKQSAELASFSAKFAPDAKADLATVMIERMRRLALPSGSVAAVTPQNWLFLGGYRAFRVDFLSSSTLSFVAVLGERCFESSAAAGAFTAMTIQTNSRPSSEAKFMGMDVSTGAGPKAKSDILRGAPPRVLRQIDQVKNPDSRITVDEYSRDSSKLALHADCYQGIRTGDRDRFVLSLWEIQRLREKWAPFRNSSDLPDLFHGISEVIRWDRGQGELHEYARETRDKLHDMHESGNRAWNKVGIAINQMRGLKASLYFGEKFDGNVNVIIPKDPKSALAILAYCMDGAYNENVRLLDKKVAVTNATLIKVPFDNNRWKEVAADAFQAGLPLPQSTDPTQWFFHGHPAHADNGTELHVALARIAGYRWPAETEAEMRLSDLARERIKQAAALASPDADGLLTLHPTGSDRTLADRLRAMLAAAYGKTLTPAEETALVRTADERLDKKEARDTSLESWLRDRAFRQHCMLFKQRPFLWQVWDGGKGGFSAFLHYHRLDRPTLEKLTHTLLGDWIARMKAEGRTAEEGWAAELQRKLKLILHGEKPHDIFVRWKSLAKQPLGWEPDLDDGVRLNIRPFIEAGVLRETPKINWNKDRGTDPTSAPWYDLGPAHGEPKGARINAHHLTRAEKEAARQRTAE